MMDWVIGQGGVIGAILRVLNIVTKQSQPTYTELVEQHSKKRAIFEGFWQILWCLALNHTISGLEAQILRVWRVSLDCGTFLTSNLTNLTNFFMPDGTI